MPLLDLGTPSEIWGRDSAELRRSRPAERVQIQFDEVGAKWLVTVLDQT